MRKKNRLEEYIFVIGWKMIAQESMNARRVFTCIVFM